MQKTETNVHDTNTVTTLVTEKHKQREKGKTVGNIGLRSKSQKLH